MSETPRCRDCRWWEPRMQHGHGLRRGWGWCGLTGDKDGNLVDANTAKAMAEDHEGYMARLSVSPDFGCVQWEAKA